LFVFAGWTGTAVDKGKVADPNQSSIVVTVDKGYTLKAHFKSILNTLRVDPAGDPNGDGTWMNPLLKIQDAIEVAAPEARVIIRAGTYPEMLTLKDTSVTLTGQWLIDSNVTTLSVVDGNGIGSVVTALGGTDSHYVIEGLRITGDRYQTEATIQCNQSHLTMSHCLINGNRAADSGSLMHFTNSQVFLEYCVVTGNHIESDGALIKQEVSTLVVSDSIIWHNTGNIFDTFSSDEAAEIRYSVVEGGWPGIGILNVDPLFADNGTWDNNDTPEDNNDDVWHEGDYHLQSQTGRYNPLNNRWERDEMTSLGIDAGDPLFPWLYEPVPHGERINMGLYGGTSQASRSPVRF
jgi:hypothetical protein